MRVHSPLLHVPHYFRLTAWRISAIDLWLLTFDLCCVRSMCTRHRVLPHTDIPWNNVSILGTKTRKAELDECSTLKNASATHKSVATRKREMQHGQLCIFQTQPLPTPPSLSPPLRPSLSPSIPPPSLSYSSSSPLPVPTSLPLCPVHPYGTATATNVLARVFFVGSNNPSRGVGLGSLADSSISAGKCVAGEMTTYPCL